MASQPTVTVQASEQQASVPTTNVDRQSQPAKSYEGELPTDEHLASINQQLHGAAEGLELCRRDLYGIRDVFSTTQRRYEDAYRQQQHVNIQCTQEYRDLYTQYAKIVDDHRSLKQELQAARTAALAHELVVQQYERRLAYHNSAEQVDAKERLESRIRDLEKENSELRTTLANAADVINYLEGRVNGLESTNQAEYPQESALDSAEKQSPRVGKRQNHDESENKAAKGHNLPAKKSRKRKAS